MYQNEYNIRELLELALRVPEIGAVNFNILYYILKTIIQKQGIAEVKPDFRLQTPFTTSSNKLRVSLRRSHSAESLTTSEAKRTESEEDFSRKKRKSTEKESEKFQKILFSKRMNGVEEEISELHIILAQLADKISNSERVIGLQETKFMKQITDMRRLLESQEGEYDLLARKFEEISSEVSMLFEMAAKSKETEEGKDEVKAEDSDFEPKVTKPSEAKLDEIALRDEKLEDAMSDEPTVEDARLDKISSDDILLDEAKESTTLNMTSLEDVKSNKISIEYVESNRTSLEDVESNRTSLEDVESNETNLEEPELQTDKNKSDEAKSDQELLDKIEAVNKEIDLMKKQLEAVEKSSGLITEKVKRPSYAKEVLERTEEKKVEEKEKISKSDMAKIDLELLSVSSEVNKLMEKCAAIDKIFSSELKIMKEKYLIFEQTFSVQKEDLEALKLNWDEMVHSFEGIKENLQYIEKEMAVLTEFPGIRNRVELLEEYMYSGSESEGKVFRKKTLITDVEKETALIAAPEGKDVAVFKPTVKRAEKAKAQKIEDLLETEAVQRDFHIGGKFLAVSRNIALIQDMDRKRRAEKFKVDDLDEDFEDEDDFLYEEQVYEPVKKPEAEGFGFLEEIQSHTEVKIIEQQPEDKGSTFTSPDALEEYSHQLRGQVIVFVKKRLHDFEIELQQIEGNLISTGKKVDSLEKMSRDLNEKVTFMDANFSQRAGDLATLKELAGNHQGSIINIVHHLERKAEAYVVNQKVSRKELTVIEDRVLKLCGATSSEISKLEERMDEFLAKFTFELDKKLFTEEFEVRLEFLLHKLKMFEKKLKDASIKTPLLDFEGIKPPVQIKKYTVFNKDGTKLRQDRRRIATWNNSDSIIPILTQNQAGLETSPKTSAQIKKELELASYRDCKRYVEGAYTKIKVGRK